MILWVRNLDWAIILFPMASTEVTGCCSLEVLAGLQSKRQYILCPAGGGWTAGLRVTHHSTYAWHLRSGGLKVVKVLRWQLHLLDWKFREPVGGSPWDLNTGSGHRLALLVMQSQNWPRSRGRMQIAPLDGKMPEILGPFLIYDKQHDFHFDSRGQWQDFWADIWETREVVSAFLLAHLVSLRESLYTPKP